MAPKWERAKTFLFNSARPKSELDSNNKSRMPWRCRGSNPGPHTCEACALPLSYIPWWKAAAGQDSCAFKSSMRFAQFGASFYFQADSSHHWGWIALKAAFGFYPSNPLRRCSNNMQLTSLLRTESSFIQQRQHKCFLSRWPNGAAFFYLLSLEGKKTNDSQTTNKKCPDCWNCENPAPVFVARGNGSFHKPSNHPEIWVLICELWLHEKS